MLHRWWKVWGSHPGLWGVAEAGNGWVRRKQTFFGRGVVIHRVRATWAHQDGESDVAKVDPSVQAFLDGVVGDGLGVVRQGGVILDDDGAEGYICEG